MSKLASLAVVVMGSIVFTSIGCGSGSDVFGSSSTTGGGGSASSSSATSNASATSSSSGAGGAGGTSGSSATSSSSGKGSSSASGMMVGQPPKVKINHPGDKEMRPANTPIPFVGVANDPEDGVLTGAALVWTSNLTGQFGTGEMFSAPLTVGTHVITLTATDSDNNTGTAMITLFIQ